MAAPLGKMSVEEIAVKKAAVRVLHGVCEVVLGEANAFTETLTLAVGSANDKTFEYNYRIAEQEFRRLPPEVVELVVGKCTSHIAANQQSILRQIKSLRGGGPGRAKPAEKRRTAVDWF